MGRTHFANATELRVPAGLASVLLNVRGLNDFRLKPQVRNSALPAYTVGTSDGDHELPDALRLGDRLRT